MKYIDVDFASTLDAYFVTVNAQINSELFAKKLKYKEILVAKVEEEWGGFMMFDYLWSDILFIAQIWIVPEFRKIGVGKRLLNYLEQYLQENKQIMLLSSSMENNTKAQDWHRHMGFKDCGTITEINDDGTGEVFFKKNLN